MSTLTWLKQFLVIQLALTLGISCGFWIWKGIEASLSTLMGGMIAIIPGLFFIRLFFKYQGAQQAKKIVTHFYLGEGLKLFLSLLLFTLAFQWSKLCPVPLLFAFIATNGVYWLIPWLSNENPER